MFAVGDQVRYILAPQLFGPEPGVVVATYERNGQVYYDVRWQHILGTQYLAGELEYA